ncbi:SemiSWEET transporter [Flavobacterium sp. xlx-214]|uniref:SemiSWEET transporter n=1 Tax=unclassified Flavobacterium TaxID=196869 RepID=UPI0013D4D48F|nr:MULTISPECIES: SemiSWEET transporter [unclassified Flavobacterium]MBA5793446.1 SemiSWEET transporter [Flavobacterium sp. xlx-221]QMI82782.1 SemiSWEET transporter [Flavobacterium sp. xlx-214]
MLIENILGTVAGILTSVSMLPQLFKVVKQRDVENISVVMLVVLLCGVSLWVIYGFMKNEWPIIISNAFSVVLNATLLVCYFAFKKKQK